MVAALPSQDQSNHLWVCALPEFPSTAYCSSLLHWERELKHCGTYLILDPLLFHLVLFGLMLWEPSLTSGTPHPLCPQPQKQNQAAESPNTDWTTLHYPRIRYILLAAIYTQAIVVCFKIFKHLAILRRVQRASFFFCNRSLNTLRAILYTCNSQQLQTKNNLHHLRALQMAGSTSIPLDDQCFQRSLAQVVWLALGIRLLSPAWKGFLVNITHGGIMSCNYRYRLSCILYGFHDLSINIHRYP